jgi:hypothetical protein
MISATLFSSLLREMYTAWPFFKMLLDNAEMSLLQATMLVAGNMIGTGVFLLPVNLASVGGIAIFGWVVATAGARGSGSGLHRRYNHPGHPDSLFYDLYRSPVNPLCCPSHAIDHYDHALFQPGDQPPHPAIGSSHVRG